MRAAVVSWCVGVLHDGHVDARDRDDLSLFATVLGEGDMVAPEAGPAVSGINHPFPLGVLFIYLFIERSSESKCSSCGRGSFLLKLFLLSRLSESRQPAFLAPHPYTNKQGYGSGHNRCENGCHDLSRVPRLRHAGPLPVSRPSRTAIAFGRPCPSRSYIFDVLAHMRFRVPIRFRFVFSSPSP